jgi:hypothetical protein
MRPRQHCSELFCGSCTGVEFPRLRIHKAGALPAGGGNDAYGRRASTSSSTLISESVMFCLARCLTQLGRRGAGGGWRRYLQAKRGELAAKTVQVYDR